MTKSYDERKADEQAAHKAYLDKTAKLKEIIKPLRTSIYATDIQWHWLESALERYAKDYGTVDLCPDFQRGHVWTPEQQLHYIENALRGLVAQNGFVIQFNCPNWETDNVKSDLPHGFQCIDGLQRLTAVQKYIAGEIKPFGLSVDDLHYSSFGIKGVQWRFRFEIFDFTRKADVLQHYLDLNAGGTPHSKEEIERVRAMLSQAAGNAEGD